MLSANQTSDSAGRVCVGFSMKPIFYIHTPNNLQNSIAIARSISNQPEQNPQLKCQIVEQLGN